MTTPNGWFPAVRVPPLRGGPVLRWGVLAPGTIAGDFVATVRRNTDQRVDGGRVALDRTRPSLRRPPRGRAGPRVSTKRSSPIRASTSSTSPRRTASTLRLGLLAIAAGKHVLIEKPIATSAARSARRSRPRPARPACSPPRRCGRAICRSSTCSTRCCSAAISARSGWPPPTSAGRMGADAPARLLDPASAAAAALDMGVYGYWFAQFAIGRPQLIRAVGSMTSTGVDEQAVVAIAGPEGRHASVTTSMAVTTSGLAAVHGTLGSARFLDPFVFPARFVVDMRGRAHEWQDTSGLTVRAGLAWQTTAIAHYIDQRTDRLPGPQPRRRDRRPAHHRHRARPCPAVDYRPTRKEPPWNRTYRPRPVRPRRRLATRHHAGRAMPGGRVCR